jgi:bifunctional NMN adenylyltransferase/nudix hydrolase
MKKFDKKSSVGVIIARLQTPFLHEGHLGLFNHVKSEHANVVVFLGIPRIQNTKRNPLDFQTRAKMVLAIFPNVVVLPIQDNRSDIKWSADIDANISTLFPDKEAVIYGSRDSFIPHYHGKQMVEEYPAVGEHNATELREDAAEKVHSSPMYRAGVIYGINKQRPVTYPTVDVVVANDNGQILLARKPAETLFRFVGGFVDRDDKDWEMAARRELYEETKLSALKMHYVCSQAVEDWRYAKEESGIMTTLFLTYDWDQMGRPEASDDIQEVRWFNLTDLFDVTTEPSQDSGHVPKVNFEFHLEDKIVPEHIKLMETFLKKALNDKLIVKKEV